MDKVHLFPYLTGRKSRRVDIYPDLMSSNVTFKIYNQQNSRACQARELRKEKTRFCMMHSTAKRKPQNEKAD